MLLAQVSILLQLGPQLLSRAVRIELRAACNTDFGQNTTTQIIGARHAGDLLSDANTLHIALCDEYRLSAALCVLLLRASAILKGERYGNLTLLRANILHRPHEDGARQAWVLVVVRYDGRNLTTNQSHAVRSQIVFGPGARIQTRISALRVVDIWVPGI